MPSRKVSFLRVIISVYLHISDFLYIYTTSRLSNVRFQSHVDADAYGEFSHFREDADVYVYLIM